jgi:hypothetical protein
MGYYADGAFSLDFRDEAAIIAAAAAVALDEDGPVERTADEAREVIAEAANEVGENNEASWDDFEEGVSLTISGWSGGKFYEDRWSDLLNAIAPYASGYGDWRGEDDNLWRDRLAGDGEVRGYRGTVVFPDDPLDSPLDAERLAALREAVAAADAAAEGDSNDAEIEALRDALDQALALVPGYAATGI